MIFLSTKLLSIKEKQETIIVSSNKPINNQININNSVSPNIQPEIEDNIKNNNIWRPIFTNLFKKIIYSIIDFFAQKTNFIGLHIAATNICFSKMPGYALLINNSLLNSINKNSFFYKIYNNYIFYKSNKLINNYLIKEDAQTNNNYFKSLQALCDLYIRNRQYQQAFETSNKMLYLQLYSNEKEDLIYTMDIIKAALTNKEAEKKDLIISFINDFKKNSRYISLIYAAKLFFSMNYNNKSMENFLIHNINHSRSSEQYLEFAKQININRIQVIDSKHFKGKNIGINKETKEDLLDLKLILDNINFASPTHEINILISFLLNLIKKDLKIANRPSHLENEYITNNYTVLAKYLPIFTRPKY